ncbi:MAG: bifunctional tetrahydrofolate synthase/dihydrofolate synthase [Burkholderiales bacterium]|nr:bifunctional tetrahydrofolate synthase/dihydrofolate synthase [Burkholderiales bacterium]
MTLPATLAGWLEYIERQHPQSIALGLDRVRVVRDVLGLQPVFPLITVGGTNGKGSACMMLDAILGSAGYRVGTYTSPHLLHYNERVRIAGREAGDADLVSAFAAVEAARAAGKVPLTYFEFGTLAALWLFCRSKVDAAILEIGLGGRLDAVNAFDADVALLMSVGLDHMDYLGNTREAIGFEKAHIFRAGRPAICADAEPPATVTEYATGIGAELLLIGRDFSYQAQPQQWSYRGPGGDRHGLPPPALRGSFQLANASACITALDALRGRLPVTSGNIRDGLVRVENPGRFQVLPGRPTMILDVAHNPHAAAALAANLAQMTGYRNTLAVFSMLKDKDVGEVVRVLRGHVDHWLVAPLQGARALPVAELERQLRAAGVTVPITICANIAEACDRAYQMAGDGDRILAFGSFLAVAAAMTAVRTRRDR